MDFSEMDSEKTRLITDEDERDLGWDQSIYSRDPFRPPLEEGGRAKVTLDMKWRPHYITS